jgi:dipeptidase
MNRLRKNKGKITPEIIMATLRDHNIKPSKQDEWDPSQGSMKSPCMHYTSFITPSQSVGSHVAHLKKDLQIHWVTGTSAPCTSIFKPIFLPKSGLTAHFPRAEGEYDEETLWWRHEKLHRLVLMDYQKRLNIYRDERNQMEAEFLKKTRELIEKISSPLSQDNIDQLISLTNESLKNSMQKTLEWIDSIKNLPRDSIPGYFYRRRWKKLNSHDNLTL